MIPIYEMTAQEWADLPREQKETYPDVNGGVVYPTVHTNYWLFAVSEAMRLGVKVQESSLIGLTHDERFTLFRMAGTTDSIS